MTLAQYEHAECCICGEKLSDPVSISRGSGPVCAAKLANFLVAVGSSAQEIAELVLIDDSAVARWLRVAARAVGAGQSAQAKRFFEAARAAAKVAQDEVTEEKAA
jgi:uncharacterized ferredoxin-like protein